MSDCEVLIWGGDVEVLIRGVDDRCMLTLSPPPKFSSSSTQLHNDSTNSISTSPKLHNDSSSIIGGLKGPSTSDPSLLQNRHPISMLKAQ